MHAIGWEGPDASRTPSKSIWGLCPFEAIKKGEVDGVAFFDDFVDFPKTFPTTEGNFGRYAGFSDTGGTANNLSVTTLGGVLAIGSDGDNEGAGIRLRSTSFLVSRDTIGFWFEARVKKSTIADTKHGFFLGLLEDVALTAILPIQADGTLSDNNMIGFWNLEGDGDAVDTYYKANTVTAVAVQADAVTLVADTYVKLGMKFRPNGDKDGTFNVSFYQNGTRLATSKQIPAAAGTDFPNDVAMGLVFAVLNATGSTPGTTAIDWWKAAQVYT